MQRSTRALLAVVAAIGVAAGGYSFAAAASNTDPGPVASDQDGDGEAQDSDAPLTGGDLDQAVAAALEHTGGGEVIETETGDDGAAFGVEVRLEDGSAVEVNLDADFVVIGSEPDDD